MREFLINLLKKRTEGPEIALFNFWHILYFVIIVGGSIAAGFLLKNKSQKAKDTVLKVLAYVIPGLYILDFLLMPLAHSDFSIDVDKLPFHICTLMAFFVPFAQFNKRFEVIKDTIVCVTLTAALMYITYPGSAVGEISPWCYKILQTFLYHGAMFAWGYLSLAIGGVRLEWKKFWKVVVGIALIILWAAFGNVAYSHEDHHYDWVFLTGSTFPFIPKFLMPYVVLVAVSGMCAIVTAIYYFTVKYIEKRKAEKATDNA